MDNIFNFVKPRDFFKYMPRIKKPKLRLKQKRKICKLILILHSNISIPTQAFGFVVWPVKWTQQKPETVKSIEMLGRLGTMFALN